MGFGGGGRMVVARVRCWFEWLGFSRAPNINIREMLYKFGLR